MFISLIIRTRPQEAKPQPPTTKLFSRPESNSPILSWNLNSVPQLSTPWFAVLRIRFPIQNGRQQTYALLCDIILCDHVFYGKACFALSSNLIRMPGCSFVQTQSEKDSWAMPRSVRVLHEKQVSTSCSVLQWTWPWRLRQVQVSNHGYVGWSGSQMLQTNTALALVGCTGALTISRFSSFFRANLDPRYPSVNPHVVPIVMYRSDPAHFIVQNDFGGNNPFCTI